MKVENLVLILASVGSLSVGQAHDLTPVFECRGRDVASRYSDEKTLELIVEEDLARIIDDEGNEYDLPRSSISLEPRMDRRKAIYELDDFDGKDGHVYLSVPSLAVEALTEDGVEFKATYKMVTYSAYGWNSKKEIIATCKEINDWRN